MLNGFGRSEEAARLIDGAIDEVSGGDRSGRLLDLLRSEIAFVLGDWDTAEDLLPERRQLAHGSSRVNANLRRAELLLGRGEIEPARALLEESWEMLSDSVEPQYISGTATLLAELELRERRVGEARAVVALALDRLEYCTEDAARIAQIAVAGVAVEAAAAEHARDLGDEAAEGDALQRAELMLARTEASAEDSGGPVELARLATARAEGARAQGAPDAAQHWVEAAEAWESLGWPYPRARALWRLSETLAAADDRDAAAGSARAAHELAEQLGSAWLTPRARVARRASPARARARRAGRRRDCRGRRPAGRGPVRAHRARAPGARPGRRRGDQP